MKRSILITVGVAALILLLGGAGFVGGRLMSGPDVNSDDPMMRVSGSDDVRTDLGVLLDVGPAAELPDAPSDVSGPFLRREDNSLFVGTGSFSAVLVDGKWELRHDGPVVEVIATHDTLIYLDDTLLQLGGVAPSGPVKQDLTPGSLAEIDNAPIIIHHHPNILWDRLLSPIPIIHSAASKLRSFAFGGVPIQILSFGVQTVSTLLLR